MKKILTLFALLAVSFAAFAQNNTIAVPAPKTMNIGEGNEWIPLFIQGVITTNFQNYSGMKVVDRQNSDMVKAEQRLSENAEFSDADAIEMGKMTHAHLIVTGSITGKSTSYALMFSITDAETGETKASATVPNCLFSALENGDAANQISYDLMTGYGINLSAEAKKKLTQKASVMTAENTAQANVAKGIVAENSGSNIEALTYYIQAKKNDKKLSEATSRMANMSTVVSTGNFGKNAKNMIKLRNDWDKLLTEAAAFIKSNPPTFDLYYFSDIETKELTERDYAKGTMTFTISYPYLEWNNREGFAENQKVADDLVNGLKSIEQSKNWGDKINGFPWTYIDKYEDEIKIKLSLLNSNKKVISSAYASLYIDYNRDNPWKIGVRLPETISQSFDMDKFIYSDLEFKDVSVNDADTDKLYITASSENKEYISSIRPSPADVMPLKQVIEILKSETVSKVRTIKTPFYDFQSSVMILERYIYGYSPDYSNDKHKYSDGHKKVLIDFVNNPYIEDSEEIFWLYGPDKLLEVISTYGKIDSEWAYYDRMGYKTKERVYGTKEGEFIYSSIYKPKDYLFYCYPNLKTVTLRIGDKLEIPKYAFWNCDSIIDVVIDSRNSRYEKSEIVINSNAFDGCSSLSTVKYTGKKKEYYIKGDYEGNNSFYNAKQVYNFKQ